ncbi:hypothetical protein A3D81_02745 [Candidatus Curtissbacteria bacterium RIFCSPHIGHO2_02_FULL_40_17]|uniref:Uncharacterized protein n=3 Tax=Candidatus Curtissiibacteriota TaxID=1752717 RepID=A0A1F5GHH8_9BACT|nr:MAG: hypothetical protein A2693_00330 [Candidatus Curtissbacteria bacterium RIFCSPHIGHO2_01_FULL_40_12]OGD91267.1 MAG: hypothetical protein A3D81_02745 [Candidatus Curtissbacteria bacterium RIFCSPHIGHO2_02_FULL_40_17]OGE09121.1 MAG: hypothetical protein A3I53_04000 [Candidatus Curtissbacteria bacterium RIFCSPLOWO2_02_FULL_40_13b]
MTEKPELRIIKAATDNSPSVVEIIGANAQPVADPNYSKEIIVRSNPLGPSSVEFIPQNS